MGAIDFKTEARDALREMLPELEQAHERVVERVVRRVLEERDEKPQPLADILDLKPEAARKREQRDVGLRKLAVGTRGRRRVYMRATVHGYLAQKARESE